MFLFKEKKLLEPLSVKDILVATISHCHTSKHGSIPPKHHFLSSPKEF